jgi:hypothetical protein
MDDLQKLPLRALVAYAARAARRVQPIYDRATQIPDFSEKKVAVDSAISVAEGFCAGNSYNAQVLEVSKATAHGAAQAVAASDATYYAAQAAWAAVDAAHAAFASTGIVAAAHAATAASSSENAVAHCADMIAALVSVAAAAADYERLRDLNLGTYPELGDRVDATEKGPLGPLWPRGQPSFQPRLSALLGGQTEPRIELPDLELFIDPGVASKETIQEVLEALSDLNRAAGGLGLEFSVDGLLVMAQEEARV